MPNWFVPCVFFFLLLATCVLDDSSPDFLVDQCVIKYRETPFLIEERVDDRLSRKDRALRTALSISTPGEHERLLRDYDRVQDALKALTDIGRRTNASDDEVHSFCRKIVSVVPEAI